MGGEWSVTEESVKAMENMAVELTEKMAEILLAIDTLINEYEDNKDGLGVHSAEILNLLKDLRDTTNEANDPVKILVKILRKSAAIRKGHIQRQGYQSKGKSR